MGGDTLGSRVLWWFVAIFGSLTLAGILVKYVGPLALAVALIVGPFLALHWIVEKAQDLYYFGWRRRKE